MCVHVFLRALLSHMPSLCRGPPLRTPYLKKNDFHSLCSFQIGCKQLFVCSPLLHLPPWNLSLNTKICIDANFWEPFVEL